MNGFELWSATEVRKVRRSKDTAAVGLRCSRLVGQSDTRQ